MVGDGSAWRRGSLSTIRPLLRDRGGGCSRRSPLRHHSFTARFRRPRLAIAPVSHFLVIERPGHSPSVLGVFSTRKDAEEALAMLMAAKPKWSKYLSVVGKVPKNFGDGKRRTS